MNEYLQSIIRAQQSGHENEPEFMIGEQLLEMAESEPDIEEILIGDLGNSAMTLTEAAKALKKYADDNHKKSKCFCITPLVAEKILREFYGLPERESTSVGKEAARTESDDDLINLADFL